MYIHIHTYIHTYIFKTDKRTWDRACTALAVYLTCTYVYRSVPNVYLPGTEHARHWPALGARSARQAWGG